jgi:hypothetical protein
MQARIIQSLAGLAIALAVWAEADAYPARATDRTVNFVRDVKPVLARKCYACHGPTTSEGGLRLHEPERAVAELDSGLHAIVPPRLVEIALWDRVTSSDESMRMPSGASHQRTGNRPFYGRGLKRERSTKSTGLSSRRSDTSHRLPNEMLGFAIRSTPSFSKDSKMWASHRRGRQTVAPSRGAPTSTSPACLQRPSNYDFLADDSSDAWERLVDELLASPRLAMANVGPGTGSTSSGLQRRMASSAMASSRMPGSSATM